MWPSSDLSDVPRASSVSFCGLRAHCFLSLYNVPSGVPHLVFLCPSRWTSGLLPIWDSDRQAAVNVGVRVSGVELCFQLIWGYAKGHAPLGWVVGLDGALGEPTRLPSASPVWHPHLQRVGVPAAPSAPRQGKPMVLWIAVVGVWGLGPPF